jgi:hypothetical protein
MREHDILSAAVAHATLPRMQQPTMFAHDGTTIYYPTGPGRVHMITIAALADCDGSDEDFSDSTARGDVHDLASGLFCGGAVITPNDGTMPAKWPRVYEEVRGDIVGPVNHEATAQDFHDALEQWADWCDRDSARLDSLDAALGAVAAA